jgi:hypothetical protein
MPEPGGECPEFAAENDEFYWLMGLLDGIQAIINDIASGGQNGVKASAIEQPRPTSLLASM